MAAPVSWMSRLVMVTLPPFVVLPPRAVMRPVTAVVPPRPPSTTTVPAPRGGRGACGRATRTGRAGLDVAPPPPPKVTAPPRPRDTLEASIDPEMRMAARAMSAVVAARSSTRPPWERIRPAWLMRARVAWRSLVGTSTVRKPSLPHRRARARRRQARPGRRGSRSCRCSPPFRQSTPRRRRACDPPALVTAAEEPLPWKRRAPRRKSSSLVERRGDEGWARISPVG